MSDAAEPGAGYAGLATHVLDLLVARAGTLAVAESLTGGMVAAEITAAPGASRAFRGSVTAYATDLKRELLGVDAALLAERGAVDSEVARQMAVGVRRVCGADVGIATTGVAGPDEQDGKPVGTVFVAVVGPDQDLAVVVPARLEGDLARALDALPRGASAVEEFSDHIFHAIQEGWSLASLERGTDRIRSGDILIACLKTPVLEGLLLRISAEFGRIAPDRMAPDLPGILAEDATRMADAARRAINDGRVAAEAARIDFDEQVAARARRTKGHDV